MKLGILIFLTAISTSGWCDQISLAGRMAVEERLEFTANMLKEKYLPASFVKELGKGLNSRADKERLKSISVNWSEHHTRDIHFVTMLNASTVMYKNYAFLQFKITSQNPLRIRINNGEEVTIDQQDFFASVDSALREAGYDFYPKKSAAYGFFLPAAFAADGAPDPQTVGNFVFLDIRGGSATQIVSRGADAGHIFPVHPTASFRAVSLLTGIPNGVAGLLGLSAPFDPAKRDDRYPCQKSGAQGEGVDGQGTKFQFSISRKDGITIHAGDITVHGVPTPLPIPACSTLDSYNETPVLETVRLDPSYTPDIDFDNEILNRVKKQCTDVKEMLKVFSEKNRPTLSCSDVKDKADAVKVCESLKKVTAYDAYIFSGCLGKNCTKFSPLDQDAMIRRVQDLQGKDGQLAHLEAQIAVLDKKIKDKNLKPGSIIFDSNGKPVGGYSRLPGDEIAKAAGWIQAEAKLVQQRNALIYVSKPGAYDEPNISTYRADGTLQDIGRLLSGVLDCCGDTKCMADLGNMGIYMIPKSSDSGPHGVSN